MNISPTCLKSEVTQNKQYVKVGMRLYATHASDKGVIIDRNGDSILFQSDDDPSGEWNQWYDLNDLQPGWKFSDKDREFINAIKNEPTPGQVYEFFEHEFRYVLTVTDVTPEHVYYKIEESRNIYPMTRELWESENYKLIN